jgi:hypothetical protein
MRRIVGYTSLPDDAAKVAPTGKFGGRVFLQKEDYKCDDLFFLG